MLAYTLVVQAGSLRTKTVKFMVVLRTFSVVMKTSLIVSQNVFLANIP